MPEHVQQAGQAAHPMGDLNALVGALSDLEAGIADLAAGAGMPAASSAMPAPPDVAAKLAILRLALANPVVGLAPELSPFATTGHEYPAVDRVLAVHGTEARPVLEELADLGLLERHLHNRVHVCPHCAACQINFRETCPPCGSIELHIEPLLHHFSCAYVGLEREFAKGAELECPKCRERLFQLGQDYERPHETYECGACQALTESPVVGGQCLRCAHVFAAHEARLVDIHRYQMTALTARAIELGRLTALEVADILFDPEARLARLDYLVLEARREFVRLRRHPGAMSLLQLRFRIGDSPYPFFHFASANEIRDLGLHLTSTLRELDLAAPVDGATLCLLLPETDADGVQTVAERLDASLAELLLQSPEGHPVTVQFDCHTWQEAPEDLEAALRLVRGID